MAEWGIVLTKTHPETIVHRCVLVLCLLLSGAAAHAEPPASGALEAAARNGDARAMLRLGWQLQQQGDDRSAALDWFRRAAATGSVEAQYHLAQSYLNGALGIVDASEAEYWYGRMREQGVCPSVIRAPNEM